jgi:tRNA (mo5U34)-methyltransferase
MTVPQWTFGSDPRSAAPDLSRFLFVQDADALAYNATIYKRLAGIGPAQNTDRFTHWWYWSQQNGLNDAEYLLPQIRVATTVAPFTFEQRFIDSGRNAPDRQQVDALAPWVYQVEFGEMSTLGVRNNADYFFHRYRAGLLADTASAIAGKHRAGMSVLDVGCHCGVFSLQLAERGFGHVTGVDLRPSNVRQAEFLRDTFEVPNVLFVEKNVRRLRDFPVADVVFCGGLLYHVTFPMDLIRDLWSKTGQFLVFDTITHKYPYSGFHLVCNKDVNYTAEGEFSYELHPTYRAVCDALYAVGFKVVYELIGSGAPDVPLYDAGNVRSFVAAKTDDGVLAEFITQLPRCRIAAPLE